MKMKTKMKTMKKKDYIPIKYLGSMILNNNITYQTLYRSICDFITSCINTFFQVTSMQLTRGRGWNLRITGETVHIVRSTSTVQLSTAQ